MSIELASEVVVLPMRGWGEEKALVGVEPSPFRAGRRSEYN